jgi:hypothetical protein
MSLKGWLDSGWLVSHTTSAWEISDLLAVVDRDLKDCRAEGLSPDWRLNIAYNAALLAATAALAACGYRAAREAHHYRAMQSLAFTIGASPEIVAQLDRFRKKRNIGGYERAGAVSDLEAQEMFTLAVRIRKDVEHWLMENHPNLFKK